MIVTADRGSGHRPLRSSDRGISMLWTALAMFFLMGAAALAIDTSDGFGSARTDQNTADLACLAGVRELPDQTDAINTAVAYLDANWPAIAGATLNVTLPTATYDAGDGNHAFLDTAHGTGGDAMLIRITEVNGTSFAKAIGQDTITVTQEAACSGQSVKTGFGMVPVGALPGDWNGDLFDCAAKVTGNCGALSPQGGGANAYRDAVANGINGNFIKHRGNRTAPDPGPTNYVTISCMNDPCNVTRTEPGNMTGPWNQGLTIRFSSGVGCVDIDGFNCDTLGSVFPGVLEDLDAGSEPGWWVDELYGAFPPTGTNHWHYEDDEFECYSPRLATIPIVNKDLDWDIPDAAGTWPTGKKDMKMIGFYSVFITEPATLADVGGPMEADVIWFGPNVTCEETGELFQPLGSTMVLDIGVKLVAP